ncbi:ABC transporter permease [Conexibacter woesei]|uniref:Binding-protein-dependent transport systems inner membrane component n=1 Tax=Conexibacter woesei (strain DSM 14684 / CCUG 47730 / CIP 108061 / JCM 11494 / NBRC 100937 / ID131577) TaxID=469383 RepID=D3FEK6_CONWI|nr:ABC transporter permease [Conexibacter woesei]ADB49680.1 binding-protein-dependent transport systems inner membrane component [Conexibacter woesei DSM 14684]
MSPGARRFLLRRVAQAAFVIFGVACVTFLVLRLVPGDPARLMVPPGSSEETVQQIRERLGTDDPLLSQFWSYLQGLVQGDLGESFRHERPVLELVLEAIPATLMLAMTTLVFALLVAVPLGIAAAARPGGLLDRFTLVVSMVGQSLPNFWIGVMLVLLFAVERQWFPAIGNEGPKAYVLPTITLSAVLIAALLRTVRQSMMEALHEDYVRTARAKGVPQHRILLVHALKNASLPLVTVLGLQIGFVFGAAFVVELIFNWPGVGLLTLQAIETRDFPVVQGVVMVVATVFVLANLLVDVAYAYLNPRVRLGLEA